MNRQFRELSDETKRRISTSMANRPKSDLHKANISKSLKAYWEKIPNRPSTENNSVTNSNNGTEEKM